MFENNMHHLCLSAFALQKSLRKEFVLVGQWYLTGNILTVVRINVTCQICLVGQSMTHQGCASNYPSLYPLFTSWVWLELEGV